MTNYNNGSIKMDVLKNTYKSDELAEYVFDYLAERQRNHRITSPERLMAILSQGSFTVNKGDVIRFFRKLEEAGCGKYVEGRRGHRSRFVWYVRMSDVGQAAQGSKETVEEIPQDEVESVSDEVDDEGELEETITHDFVLRPDFSLRLTLPLDLKTSEASRISDWVRTLPFE